VATAALSSDSPLASAESGESGCGGGRRRWRPPMSSEDRCGTFGCTPCHHSHGACDHATSSTTQHGDARPETGTPLVEDLGCQPRHGGGLPGAVHGHERHRRCCDRRHLHPRQVQHSRRREHADQHHRKSAVAALTRWHRAASGQPQRQGRQPQRRSARRDRLDRARSARQDERRCPNDPVQPRTGCLCG
jgi:hypothetical protein